MPGMTEFSRGLKKIGIMTWYKSKPSWGSFIILNFLKVTYILRKLIHPDISGPGLIRLRNGDKIVFKSQCYILEFLIKVL